MEKAFYVSKRFWFNALTVIFVAAQFFGFTPNEALAEQTTNVLVAIVPLINIFLAWVSKKPLGFGVFGE